MKMNITKQAVTIEDDSGGTVVMTTDQLLEMVRTINAATNQDGVFLFSLLEFTF